MISDETHEKWKTKIEIILEAYEYGCIELNEWEIDFIETIQNINNNLSWKQSKVLNKIFEKV